MDIAYLITGVSYGASRRGVGASIFIIELNIRVDNEANIHIDLLRVYEAKSPIANAQYVGPSSRSKRCPASPNDSSPHEER